MQSMLAFENPWQILELLGIVVLLRALAAWIPFLGSRRGAIVEMIDSGLVAVLLVFRLETKGFLRSNKGMTGSGVHPSRISKRRAGLRGRFH